MSRHGSCCHPHKLGVFCCVLFSFQILLLSLFPSQTQGSVIRRHLESWVVVNLLEEEYIGVGEVLSSQLLILKMDTEELIRRCKEISLSGETRGKVSFKGNLRLKGEKIVAGCLIGKVLHNREVNLEGLRLAMSQVW